MRFKSSLVIFVIWALSVKYPSKLSINEIDNGLFEKKPFALTIGVNYYRNRRAFPCFNTDGRGKSFLSGRISYSTDGRSSFQLRRIPLSGDVHVHPGSRQCGAKYSCKECHKRIRSNQHALSCSECNGWSHMKCLNMSKAILSRTIGVGLDLFTLLAAKVYRVVFR